MTEHESHGASKNFWLPLATWIFGVIVITILLLVFYTPSPAIIATYLVIVFIGFYILWRSRKIVPRKEAKKAEVKEKNEKAVSVRRKRK